MNIPHITTLPDLIDKLIEYAEKQTPEQKARMHAALLKFAEGKKSMRRGEWVN